MKKVLFVCYEGKNRSKTAADLLKGSRNIEAKSCGVDEFGMNPVDEKLIAWADLIVIMSPVEKDILKQKFGNAVGGKEMIVLDIEDIYFYMNPELVRILKEKFKEYGIS